MLINFVIIGKRVSAAGYITTAVKICFSSKTVDNSIIKAGRVNHRFVSGRGIIFSKVMNIVRDAILAVFMNNEIYTTLYQSVHKIMFGQYAEHNAKNCHSYGPPCEKEGI